MAFATALLVAAFLSILANGGFVEGFLRNPIQCAPRKAVIPSDAPRYQYYPFFVDVYRCSGGCSTISPKTYHCTAKTWNNITGNVVDLQTNTVKEIAIQNHTSCECACVTKAQDCSENEDFQENTCSCLCKYQDQPPTGCPGRFSWNTFQCKCVCEGPVEFCPVFKEWSHTACGCVCTRSAVEFCKSEKKFLNATTCECEEPIVKKLDPGVTGKRTDFRSFPFTVETSNWKQLVGWMVGELVVLILLFDLILYCKYSGGFIFNCLNNACCCRRKGSSNNGQAVANNGTPAGSNAVKNDSPTIRNNLLETYVK